MIVDKHGDHGYTRVDDVRGLPETRPSNVPKAAIKREGKDAITVSRVPIAEQESNHFYSYPLFYHTDIPTMES